MPAAHPALPRWHRTRHFRWGVCVAACALVGLTGGCSTSIVRRSVERRVEKRLVNWLGPAERYRVRIRGTRDPELVQGRADKVVIRGTRIFARKQFELESLLLTLDDLRYEGGDPYFISVRRSDLVIEFTDQALNDYLKRSGVRYDPKVRFSPDRVHVSMMYRFLGTPTPIQASGRFIIQEGRRLLFDADESDVSFLNVPGFGPQFVEDRVNPLLDISKFDFPARLESVQVLDGKIRAHGTAALLPETKN